jgi:hypothetical protein
MYPKSISQTGILLSEPNIQMATSVLSIITAADKHLAASVKLLLELKYRYKPYLIIASGCVLVRSTMNNVTLGHVQLLFLS